MRVRLRDRPVPLCELLRVRLLPSRIDLPAEWSRYYWGDVRTRRIAHEQRHRLKLAA
jgi:hypothetical protein